MDGEKIGCRLVGLRGKKPQIEVAEDLKISVSALSMYEQGQRIPRDEVKKRIAKYYGVSLETLFYAD